MTTWEDTRIRMQNATIGGFAQAAAFTWWDRAVYLSVKEGRPFLHRENFKHPYQGFLQAAVYRTFSAGLYWFLQDEFYELMGPLLAGVKRDKMIIGVCTGTANGMILNQFATIRYYMWGQDEKSFWTTARHMWKDGGIRPFFRGLLSTTSRDALYGAVYEETRWRLYDSFASTEREKEKLKYIASTSHVPGNTIPIFKKFNCDMLAASLGTIAASPFNFVRNLKFATTATKPTPTTLQCFMTLWDSAKTQPTVFGKFNYVQQRFVLGWGLLQIGPRMALSQLVFDYLKGFYSKDRIR